MGSGAMGDRVMSSHPMPGGMHERTAVAAMPAGKVTAAATGRPDPTVAAIDTPSPPKAAAPADGPQLTAASTPTRAPWAIVAAGVAIAAAGGGIGAVFGALTRRRPRVGLT